MLLDKIKLLRYESPIVLLALTLITIFIIGGLVFGTYKLFFEEKTLPTVGGNGTAVEDVKETTITKDTVKVPEKLDGVKITPEELKAANAAMSDEGAYEGGFENTASPPKEDLYMEGVTEDTYVKASDAARGIGVQGQKSEAEAMKEISSKISSVSSDRWLGRELSESEEAILQKIKADPKNCYPEFGTVQAFNYVKEGYGFEAVYSDLLATIIMCDGDINNYDCGIY